MISSPAEMMYLRPGNLLKEFIVKRSEQKVSDTGMPFVQYMDTGNLIRGVLAEADKNQSDRKKHLWDQEQHSLTHTIVCRGEAAAQKGDILAMDNRIFMVLLADDVGGLGVSTIYYAEERNDIK